MSRPQQLITCPHCHTRRETSANGVTVQCRECGQRHYVPRTVDPNDRLITRNRRQITCRCGHVFTTRAKVRSAVGCPACRVKVWVRLDAPVLAPDLRPAPTYPVPAPATRRPAPSAQRSAPARTTHAPDPWTDDADDYAPNVDEADVDAPERSAATDLLGIGRQLFIPSTAPTLPTAPTAVKGVRALGFALIPSTRRAPGSCPIQTNGRECPNIADVGIAWPDIPELNGPLPVCIGHAHEIRQKTVSEADSEREIATVYRRQH